MQNLASFGAASDPIQLITLAINLAVGVALSLVLRWHFEQFGSTLSNREEFAQVFPFVLLTTALIITIVKASLALSLGLVGALSIVRFRTPIKEPEELAYLFIAIAMGLGLGANQTVPTVLAGLAILAVMAVLMKRRQRDVGKRLYLSVEMPGKDAHSPQDYLSQLTSITTRHTTRRDLRRYDIRNASLEATFMIDVSSADNLLALTEDLRKAYPNIGVTFLDQSQMPSV